MHSRQHTATAVAIVILACSVIAGAEATPPDYQHGISLLHELKYDVDFKHFDYANPDAPKGGRLVLSASTPIQNVSGAWGVGIPNAPGLERTMDRLFVRSADEPSALYGLILDGIALSDDKRRLYLRIHPDARWHDGAPLTTTDLRFSYDALMATATHERFNIQAWLAEFEVVNERELILHHKDVFTHNNLLSLSTFAVRAAHYYAEHEDGDPWKATLQPPLGNGPYKVATFDRDFIEYERVSDYWARDHPAVRGRSNFDSIRYDIYRDTTVAREAFRKGLFDVFWETDVRYWHAMQELPAMQSGRMVGDTRTVIRFIGQRWAMAFNLDRPTFQDVRVREALTLAFNFDWQNRVFHYGSQSRAFSYFAGSRFAATGLPSAEELALLEPLRDDIPKRVFTHVFELPSSDGVGQHRDALAHASQLLSDAGWQLVDGERRNAEGQRLRIEIATQNSGAKRWLIPYVDSLAILGIDARVRLLDSALAMHYKRKRQYDMYLRGHDLVNPPMGQLNNYFSTTAAEMMMGGNLTGLRSPTVDSLIEMARTTPDLETAETVVRALDRVLLWGFYHVPLNEPEAERFLYWNKFGRPDESSAIYEYLTGGITRVIDSWWAVDEDPPSELNGP